MPTIRNIDTIKSALLRPALTSHFDVEIGLPQGELGQKLRQVLGGTTVQQDRLNLMCSEAVLPGSDMQVAQIDGLRQGISTKYATFRRFPDIILTYYLQTDYYTNDVFNAWMEYMSPSSSRENLSYRRMKYPETYKCDMEITAFSKAIKDNFSKLNQTSRFNNVLPSSITYKLRNVFPSSIVAAPLAYGKAELIKTTITFKYDEYFIDRTSRVGGTFAESVESNRIVPQSTTILNTESEEIFNDPRKFDNPQEELSTFELGLLDLRHKKDK